jgi:hypothetical protein
MAKLREAKFRLFQFRLAHLAPGHLAGDFRLAQSNRILALLPQVDSRLMRGFSLIENLLTDSPVDNQVPQALKLCCGMLYGGLGRGGFLFELPPDWEN